MSRIQDTIKRQASIQGIMMIMVAAILLAATSLIQSYFAHQGLLAESERRAQRELAMTQLRIEKVTESVETVVRNNSWVAELNLADPDTLFYLLRNIIDKNPVIADAAFAFTPHFYAEKGYWYEPLVARRENGELEEMVLGSASHDYFNTEWYLAPIRSNSSRWSEPYYDESGGKAMVITYSSPMYDRDGECAGVVAVDITLDWLAELLEDVQLYPDTYSTLESRNGQMLVSPKETPFQGPSVSHTMQMENTGWTMTTVIPRKEIFKSVDRLALWLTLLQLIGLALLAIIATKSVKNQARLEAVRENKNKIENELHIAREIQMSMLPKTFPPFPERTDIDLSAAVVPAKEVGGDLYDFFIRNDKLYFCIGDVSGKGVPASLVMAVTRSLFRTVSAHEKSPMRIVSSMNESMSDMNNSNMFVTFFCGVLDLNNGKLLYCNAGHNSPFFITDEVAKLPVEPNLPLGVMPEMVYREQEPILAPGNTIFMYTDGLSEAENVSNELYGVDRIMKVLSPDLSATDNQEKVLDNVWTFTGEAERSDDLTLLIIRYLGAADVPFKERHLILHNDIQQIPQLADFILTIAEEMHLSQSLSMSLNLALEEAVTNVIMYAYPKGSDGLVIIEAILREKSLDFIVTDSGQPFDPTAAPEVDTALDLDERPIGGLGIHLVRKIMDKVHYERKDGQNILSMTKNI